MGLIWFLITGFVVGLLARAIMPGKDPMSWVLTTLLGVVGSFAGWGVGRLFGLYGSHTGITGAGFIMSLLGAIAVLAIWRRVSARRHVPASRG